MNCKDCLPLIPSYLDEELSEAQAAPLRQHLMDCRLCRKALSGERAFKRWFEHEPVVEVAVPAGFAARVARRAFAGDLARGDRDEARAGREHELREAPLLRFALASTAIAAAVLLAVSMLISQAKLPDGDTLRAGGNLDKETLIEKIESLDDPARSTDAVEDSGGDALTDMAQESAEMSLEEGGRKGDGQ